MFGRYNIFLHGGNWYQFHPIHFSPTIIKYLAAKYKVADHWFPSGDLKVQARINEYLDWQHTGLRQDGTAVFRGMVRHFFDELMFVECFITSICISIMGENLNGKN